MWEVLKGEDIDVLRKKLFDEGYVKHGAFVLVHIDDLCNLLTKLKEQREEIALFEMPKN